MKCRYCQELVEHGLLESGARDVCDLCWFDHIDDEVVDGDEWLWPEAAALATVEDVRV